MALDIEFNSQHFIAGAVNILLQSIGELPIETLEDIDNVLEAKIAKDVLIESKNTILSMGWNINTDSDYTLYPDSNGKIIIPPHVLDIKSGSTITVRDWMLYDKDNKTRIFTSPVSCDIIWNQEFNSLPHAIRYYITIFASRVFQARQISDQFMYKFTQEDENRALIAAKHSNGFTSEFNILNSSYAGNFTVL